MSIEITEILTESDARRLTERIRYTAMSVRDGVEKLQRLVAEAQAGQAHVALGYKSWTAYLADVMGDEPLVLARDQRRDVVAWLAGEGMSTRDIAAVVGAGNATVHRDIAASVSDGTVERPDLVVSHDGRERPSAVSREVSSETLPPAAPSDLEPLPPFDPETGEVLDEERGAGKTYTRPEPKPRPVDPRKGTDLYALRMAVVPALDAWAAQWSDKPLLDDSVTAEEAAQILRDLSRLTPVLSQIRRLLTTRTEPTK